MKILYVGKYFKPYRGGIETVTEDLCSGVSEAGHQVVGLVCNEVRFENRLELQESNYSIIKKKQYGAFLSTPISLWTAKEINSYKADIVHFHLPNPLPLFCLNEIKAVKVATFHSSIVNKGLAGSLYNYVHKRQLRSFDKIIVTSNNITKSHLFKKLHLKPSIISMIPLSVKLQSYQEKSLGLQKKIVFSGRFVEYKGLEHVVEAMKTVDAQLSLIGDGPLKLKLKKQIYSLGLKDKVKLIPSMPRESLLKRLPKFDIFVLPSINEAEAFGMSALEAMSLGLPIVSTQLMTGVSEVNQNGKTGFVVKPKSSKLLAEGINKILSQPVLYQKMSRSCIDRARTVYSYSRFIKTYLDLYEELLLSHRI